ncbi:MAG: aminotransferase class V-fold PLP-dependent enzyme [Nitrospinota bacterium]|mgnify:CR=1 FL=1|nr:aminotransferase class V-fold PLP-dependent enzyme [Nitrospinota bacterium]MDP7166521.1 aminotransferase class V-fold PLP-dependent enzyme [Nitrospinota bacterium]MDP7371232.1 aminotransferase class V-fold PLP-dependent enzyme [Nitrospinota bacterium]MDP7503273.1 aminotransferase class V-fold PLP-dependent enzyme [Nitrospinota bacterium]MDP7663214.1 aminotransferase class V-fold PLP-dependent enzyme [Nitrospinota bacterium]
MAIDKASVRRLRGRIPAMKGQVYVNWGGSGPSPAEVLREVDRILKRESRLGPFHPQVKDESKAVMVALRLEVSKLLGAREEEIALVDNTTSGVNIAAAGVEWRAGDEAIVTDLEHPGGYLPWLMWRERRGRIKVRLLETGASDEELLSNLRAMITPRTRAVCVSHIAWLTGRRLPLREIGRLCRKAGALLVVDGAQSVGQIPVDVKKSLADVYTVSGQKWLMGPQGTGAVFVRNGLRKKILESGVGYRSAAARSLPKLTYTPQKGAIRFEIATISPALYSGLRVAVETCRRSGPAGIERRVRRLANRLLKRLRSEPGIEVLTPPGPAQSGLVSFRAPGLTPVETAAHLLKKHKVVLRSVDSVPPAVRASIHYVNTEAEIDRIAEGAADLAAVARKKTGR